MTAPTPNPPTPAPRIPPALWPVVSAGFDEALALPAAARPDWLARQAQAQPEVAFHLGRLLAAHATAQQPARPDTALFAAALAAPRRQFEAGQSVGIYRLVAPLGEGGMAVVWSAEQLQGVLRRVALKLPHAGLERPAAMAQRFERERDLLAGLEHPHIARLYDAGTTDDGQPFLAMELISGQSLTRHAQGLPLAGRLALFQQVLSAVGFAHGRLVIHRDLKPGNVLVTADGEVKLLDFGIARLLGDGETPAGAGLSGLAFTPDCAAPEQLAGQPLDVRADVYALGVVLYELLTGRRPYLLQREASTPLAEQLAGLVATGWPAPSQFLRAAAGDLDAIVARAMAVVPAQRYASVDALAADLRRFERLQPVLARRGGRGYRFSLWLRRQRLAVAAGTAVVLALGGGLGVALWQAHEARAQAVRAQAVQSLLLGFFDGVSPEALQGGDISARALVLQGSRRAEAGLGTDQGQLKADLLAMGGRLLGKLAAYTEAHGQLQRAVDQYAALGQSRSPAALEARLMLADVYQSVYEAERARQAVDALLADAAGVWPPGHPLRRRALVLQANVMTTQGQAEAALAVAAQALQAAADGPPDLLQLLAWNAQGNAALELGRWKAARQSFEQVLAAPETQPPMERSDRIAVRFNLNIALGKLGEFQRMAELGAPLLDEVERHLGPIASLTLDIRSQLAQARQRLGQYADAVALQREVVHRADQSSMLDDEFRQLQRAQLAVMLTAAGQPAEALALLQAHQAFVDAKYPQPQMAREIKRLWLAQAWLAAGRSEEAMASFAAVRQHMATLPGHAQHPRWQEALQGQALAWQQAGRGAQALPQLQQACQALAQLADTPAAVRLRCGVHLAYVRARQAPQDVAARTALQDAGSAYLAACAPGVAAVVGPELRWLQAAVAGQPAAQRLAEQDWSRALGAPWPGRFAALH
ncbi:MAG: protein kinase domain-containing protein [Rubrivivax sp.]